MATVQQRHAGGRPRACGPCRLGQFIETTAARRSMNLEQLSVESGVSLRTLYHLISGKTPDPRVSTIVALAEALDVPVSRLVKQTAASGRGIG